jgi:hypothetical protein
MTERNLASRLSPGAAGVGPGCAKADPVIINTAKIDFVIVFLLIMILSNLRFMVSMSGSYQEVMKF